MVGVPRPQHHAEDDSGRDQGQGRLVDERFSDGVVTLRPWREDDAPAVAEICQDPEIPRWTNVPSPYSEEDARTFIRETLAGDRAEMARAIVDAESGELLGAVGLRLPAPGVGEVGYWLGSHARGRGAATRAVRLMCRWAFDEFSLARMQLHTLPGNTASERVAERAGFTREGLLRSFTEMKGKRTDIVMFSLLPGELGGTRVDLCPPEGE